VWKLNPKKREKFLMFAREEVGTNSIHKDQTSPEDFYIAYYLVSIFITLGEW